MGKASSKKVARAASTGGGRTAARAGNRPWLWYAVMGVVVVLGLGGIFVSREQRRDELAASPESLTPPVANRDHWHAAYAVVLCGQLASPIQDERDPKGIHTHADGLIHIHPFLRSAAGEKANLGAFADAVRMTLTDEELKLPGGKSHREGKTKCDDKPGIVQVKVGDKVVTEDVRNIKLSDRDLITIAFAPEGEQLPAPPSASELANPKDLPPQTPVNIPGATEGTTGEGTPETGDPTGGTTGDPTGGTGETTGGGGDTQGGAGGQPVPDSGAPTTAAP